MSVSNEALWDEQRTSRNKLWKRAVVIFSILIFSLFLLLLWIAQPLAFTANIKSSQVKIDPNKLEMHVRMLSDELYPRNYVDLDNLNKAAEYIKGEFQKTGGKVSEQHFTVNGSDYRNICLELGPETADRVVVGAHYDSANLTHGADDNASGIAGLIELANALAVFPPNSKVEFVAYSLEEPPFFGSQQMGSFVHAGSLRDRQIPVRLMVCLEMIGYFSDEPNSQQFPVSIGKLIYPGTGNFIAVVGDLQNALTVRKFKAEMTDSTSLPVYSINVPAFVPGVDFSDHRNYWTFGYDALMITDSAFYRNKHYHNIDDTYEKLDYLRMAEVVSATYSAVVSATN